MVKHKSAYLYLRASSSKQDKSVEQQRKECRAFAKQHNITIINEFVDDGISAFKHGKEGRKGFNNLLEACKSGEAEYVLLWSIDRFSRQYKEGMIELLSLEILGVKIMDTIDGVYDSDDISGAIKQLLGLHGAQDYSKKLSKNVSRGCKDRKDAGFPHGMPSLGYMVDPNSNEKRKGWVPDPSEVDTVKLIFKLFDKGLTFQGICKELNSRKLKPRRAMYFSAVSIAQVLRNPVYGGFQGSVEKKRYAVGTHVKVKVQTFIDPELWKRCFDDAQPKHHNQNGEKRMSNPLTGKVWCPKCHEPAHVVSGSMNVPKYRCRGVRYTTCNHRANVTKQNLELAIAKLAKDSILKEGVEKLTNRIIKEQLEKDKQRLKSVQPLLDRLSEIDRAEGILLDAMIAGGDSEALNKKRQSLMRERESIQNKLESHGSDVEPISKEVATIKLLKQLLSFAGNLRPILPQIEKILIVGQEHVKVFMFGYEYDVDLSAFKPAENLEALYVPAKAIGGRKPIRKPKSKRK